MELTKDTISADTLTTPASAILMHHLAQSAEVGLYVLSLRGEQPRCEYANSAWCRWTAAIAPELTSGQRSWLGCFHPEDRVRMQQLYLKVLLTGATERTEYRIYSPGQDIRYAADTVRPVWDERGETIGVCGCVQDVSAIKSAQEEMQRTQLLQSLGSLMAGIAHEINTPLQFIGDNLQFLFDAWQVLGGQTAALISGLDAVRQKPGADAMEAFWKRLDQFRKESNAAYMEIEFPKAVRQSLEGIERLMQLVGAMRDFSHMDERRHAPADLNRAVGSAVTLLHNELKYHCDVKTELDPELPQIGCSIDEINRVILNLLINAGDSIAEKIEKGDYQRGCVRIGTKRQEKGVLLFVEDNGMGIPAAIQERIFERFFTTKRNRPERVGTGQGLSMAHEVIVDHHRGSLTFRTCPGEGTVFDVFLPFTLTTASTGA